MSTQINLLSVFITLLCATGISSAQNSDFSSCSAAFLDQKMIVDEYTTTGKCVIALDATGKLSVRPVELESGKDPIPGKKIDFKVAVRNGESRTLMLLSEKTYKEIDIQKVLKECRKGDYIVVITLERLWAVPHSEILVE